MNKSSCDPLFFVRPVFISLGSLALCDFNMWRLRTLTYLLTHVLTGRMQ